MKITIDTSAPLSDTDLAILALVTGTPSATLVEEPAKSPAPKRVLAPKTAPEPEPEPEEEDEDLIGGEPTVQDAVDRATALINEGKQALVKAALKTVGVDRVSNIPASKAGAFIAALEG